MAAPIYADRVKETTTTTGTGTLSMGGTVAGYQTFVAAIGNGNTTKILIDDGNGNWEVCFSVTTSGSPNTQSRGTLINSSTGSRINFTAGTKTVAIVPATDWFAVPTRQALLSGTAATYTTPTGCRQLRIRMVGGGASGGGNGLAAHANGSAGVASSFNGITANPGSAGSNNGNPGAGGTGGNNTPTAGAVSGLFRFPGGQGTSGTITNTSIITSANGGTGGSSMFGGAGSGTNTGAGANGEGVSSPPSATPSGGGGGAGEGVEFIINNPAASYTYTVGTGGAVAVGSSGTSPGASGIIIVDEIY